MEKIKKRIFIANLKEEDAVDDYFFVKTKHESRGKTGKPYISLVITDCSGEMDARIWDNVETLGVNFEEGSFVRVKGDVRIHQGKLQLAVSSIERLRVPLSSIELKEFFKVSKKNYEDMKNDFFKIIESVREEKLKALLNLIFRDGAIWNRFSYYPAAKTIHHAYIHGLLEHTLSVAKLVIYLSNHYPCIDRELAVTGGLLHDIGKIYELDMTHPDVYTLPGKLIGHLVMGVSLVEKKMAEIKDFTEKKGMLLKHIILSHHGSKEAGSPVEPQTIEALLVHLADMVDASMNSIQELLEEARSTGSAWNYSKFYARSFFTNSEEKKESPGRGFTLEGLEELKRLRERLQEKE